MFLCVKADLILRCVTFQRIHKRPRHIDSHFIHVRQGTFSLRDLREGPQPPFQRVDHHHRGSCLFLDPTPDVTCSLLLKLEILNVFFCWHGPRRCKEYNNTRVAPRKSRGERARTARNTNRALGPSACVFYRFLRRPRLER